MTNVLAGLRQNVSDSVVLTCDGESITDAVFQRKCGTLAAALQASVPSDGRVAVKLPNSVAAAISYCAVWSAGRVLVPIYSDQSLAELETRLRTSEASCLITDAATWSALPAALRSGLTALIDGEVADDSARALEQVFESDEVVEEPVEVDSDALACIAFTSGTRSGVAKGVMLSHGNLVAARGKFKLVPGAVRMYLGPFAHITGARIVMAVFAGGTHLVTASGFAAEDALQLIDKHGVNNMLATPTMLEMMTRAAADGSYDLSSLMVVRTTASAADPGLLKRVCSDFGLRGIGNAYGLTETAGSVTQAELSQGEGDAVGLPSEAVTLHILTDDGALCEPNEQGEIVISGAQVAKGYLGLPDETAATFRDGWLHTGDVGFLDGDGKLHVVGRRDDLAIRGGFNVAPREVAQVIERMPEVSECVVLRIGSDEVVGDSLAAFLTAADPAAPPSIDSIMHFCRSEMAHYKIPSWVWLVDAIPRTGTGKAKRAVLREIHGERLASSRAAVAERLAEATTPTWRRTVLRDEVAQHVTRLLGLFGDDVDKDELCERSLVDQGLDSLAAVDLAGALAELTGALVPPTVLFEYPSVDALAEYLEEQVS